MTHQLNHSRQVSANLREGWASVVAQLPEGLTEGKGASKILRPDISEKMVGAIEAMMDGPEQITQFLREYPALRAPMQAFLGVVNVLEKGKINSPELRTMFRDGYIQHIYPNVTEMRKLGVNLSYNRIKTLLNSEGKRGVDTLTLAREQYKDAVDTLMKGNWLDGEAPSEKAFIEMGAEGRARVLGYDGYQPGASPDADKAVKAILGKLALKDPVTDPGKIMESMVKSAMDAAAQRSALKNLAQTYVGGSWSKDYGRPYYVIESIGKQGLGFKVPLKDGTEGVMLPLHTKDLGLNIAPDDELIFGGKTFKAKELVIHPDHAREFVDKFQVMSNNSSPGGEKWAARAELAKHSQLIGVPLAHSWNIVSGAWQTFMTNAVATMWDGAVNGVMRGKIPGGRGAGAEMFVKGVKDLWKSPQDAISLGIIGNRAMRGQLPGVDPQVLTSDAVLHGVNLSTWNTAIRSAQEAAITFTQREDPEIGSTLKQTFAQRVVGDDSWSKYVGDEGLWGKVSQDMGDPSDPGLKRIARGGASLAEAGMKGAVQADRYLNAYLTYEPMKQAVIAAYHWQAATHWKAMGPKLIATGMDPHLAMKMVKEEAARYVNTRGGMIQHYLKSNIAGLFNDNNLYGKDANGNTTGAGFLFAPLTPGWLRSKIDFISNGMNADILGAEMGGRRLDNINNQMYKQFMRKEWRKQALLGGVSTMVAQQLFKWTLTGAGVLGAAFALDKSGVEKRFENVKAELEDPSQWTKMQLSANTSVTAPFLGQMRDMIKLIDAGRNPQAVLDLAMNNVNPIGKSAVALTTGQSLSGRRVGSFDVTSDPASHFDIADKRVRAVAHELTGTVMGDIFMQEKNSKIGMTRRPLPQIALNLLGIQSQTFNPMDKVAWEIKEQENKFQKELSTQVANQFLKFNSTLSIEDFKKGMEMAAEGIDVTGRAKGPAYALMFPDGKHRMTPEQASQIMLRTVDPDVANLLRNDEAFVTAYITLSQRIRDQQARGIVPKLINAMMKGEKEYEAKRTKQAPTSTAEDIATATLRRP